MRYVGKIISTAALLASAGCVSSRDVSQSLSFDQLLAHPSKFDGRAIVVVAYANIEFEMDELCGVPPSVPRNQRCIWLTWDDGPYNTEQDLARYQPAEEKWRAFRGKRVLVRGTFSRYPSRHFGVCLGQINRITGVKLAP